MRFFDVGQRAEGFIAIGQEATGVIALGQIATGVIAIGQAARGVVAIGQVAIGLVSAGMLSFGLIVSFGLGVGGRAGWGLVLPLVPAPRARAQLPERTDLDTLVRSRAPGWIDVMIQTGERGLAQLVHQGSVVPAELARTLQQAARNHATLHKGPALAHVVPAAEGLRVTRLMANPNAAQGLNPILLALQIVLLGVLAGAYWEIVLVPLGDFLLAMVRDLLAGATS
jgi:hypothetical protein